MQILLQIALVMHIVGITFMAGTTLVEFLLNVHFWKQYSINRVSAIASHDNGFNFHLLVDIGVLLLIVSGVAMFLVFHRVFASQIWFQVKIGLIVIIAFNGTVVGRRQDKKIKQLLSVDKVSIHLEEMSECYGLESNIRKVKKRLTFFYITQLTLFLIVFILSIFKFN